MKITQDVRDYAAKIGVSEDEVLKEKMQSKPVEFIEKGVLRFILKIKSK